MVARDRRFTRCLALRLDPIVGGKVQAREWHRMGRARFGVGQRRPAFRRSPLFYAGNAVEKRSRWWIAGTLGLCALEEDPSRLPASSLGTAESNAFRVGMVRTEKTRSAGPTS